MFKVLDRITLLAAIALAIIVLSSCTDIDEEISKKERRYFYAEAEKVYAGLKNRDFVYLDSTLADEVRNDTLLLRQYAEIIDPQSGEITIEKQMLALASKAERKQKLIIAEDDKSGVTVYIEPDGLRNFVNMFSIPGTYEGLRMMIYTQYCRESSEWKMKRFNFWVHVYNGKDKDEWFAAAKKAYQKKDTLRAYRYACIAKDLYSPKAGLVSYKGAEVIDAFLEEITRQITTKLALPVKTNVGGGFQIELYRPVMQRWQYNDVVVVTPLGGDTDMEKQIDMLHASIDDYIPGLAAMTDKIMYLVNGTEYIRAVAATSHDTASSPVHALR